MIIKKIIKLSVIFLIGLVSCKQDKKSTNDLNKKQETTQKALKINGIYQGILPCADCSGIKTIITFYQDNTVAKTTYYQDSDSTWDTQYGTWITNNTITTATFGNQEDYYLLKKDGSIAMLDKQKKEITTDLAIHYILKKTVQVKPESLNGTYFVKGTQNGGYEQFLTIVANPNNIIDVSIGFKGAKKGCTFKGKGKLVNNLIVIDLKNIEKHLKGTMTIVFNESAAEVFTEKFDDRMELMYFCGGGGSLAGDYLKK